MVKINFTENPIDIPNPDRGAYRGRWQFCDTPFGITPEVDHRVPVDAQSVLYHGRQMPPVEGDDIELTQFFNGEGQRANRPDPYMGGTGVAAMPSIAFMAFDLVNFSSNAFLSASDAFAFQKDEQFINEETGTPRTGKTMPMTPYALDYIRGLMQTVRDGDGVALVKFSYDGNGFNYIEPFKYPHLTLTEGLIHGPEPEGLCDVPGHTDKTWIEYHIHQLAPIFREFEDIIMCVKTGMIGAWGEQHSSPMSQDPAVYKMLLDAYLAAVPASRSLLTHAGGFLAWYNATYATNYTFHNIDNLPVPPPNSPEARFGFFNDSYAAGGADASDNGSLSEGAPMLVAAESDPGYDRDRILTWIHKQNNFLQGEGGLQPNEYSIMPNAIAEARRLRTTALNMRHGMYPTWQKFTITEAIDPVYAGRNGLEFFRDRMGYRLVLRAAQNNPQTEATTGKLEFKGAVQNVGFGNVINRKQVTVLLQAEAANDAVDAAGVASIRPIFSEATTLDARDWRTADDGNIHPNNTSAWRNFEFALPLSAFGDVPAGVYNVYLKINDPLEKSVNRRSIQFANHGIWNAELGANLVGQIEVVGCK
ncbi:MAG: DUF4832 domain-containing protein [Defluviitaleaceae bacterium]|nr:DUF4832 domain-containing protein [Defluviitaleaceae bacterium]